MVEMAQMLHLAAATDAPEAGEVIAQAAAGDLRAFERLYLAYAPRVYGLCLRLTGHRETAEDCTQECFVAAWRALPRFEGRSRFGTWLHRIAVNTVLGRRRTSAMLYEVSEAEGGMPEVVDSRGTPALDVEAAIERLPEGARHVLVLVAIYGYSHAEAASMLGIADGTCKAQLHRARGLLARALGLEEA